MEGLLVERDSLDQLASFEGMEDAYDFVCATFRQCLGIKAKD